MALRVEQYRDGFAIFDAYKRVSDAFDSLATARRERDRMSAEKALDERGDAPATTSRKCLCCSTTFESEGAHNRMCGRCRYRTAGLDRNMVGA